MVSISIFNALRSGIIVSIIYYLKYITVLSEKLQVYELKIKIKYKLKLKTSFILQDVFTTVTVCLPS